MRHTITAAEKAKAQARRERFRALVKQVAEMSDDQRAQLAAGMIGIATCEGHCLSGRNVCLLAMQMPTATIVGGFRQWIKQGRAVRKGEHGMMIWVPTTVKANASAAAAAGVDPASVPDETRFLIGTVFDISQTDEIQTAHDAEQVEDLRPGDELPAPSRARLSRHAAFMSQAATM